MVESDAGTGESLLNRRRDASCIAVGGYRDGPTVIHLDESGGYVLSNGVCITPPGHLTVLYVPPHRSFRVCVLRFRQTRLRRRHSRRDCACACVTVPSAHVPSRLCNSLLLLTDRKIYFSKLATRLTSIQLLSQNFYGWPENLYFTILSLNIQHRYVQTGDLSYTKWSTRV